MFREPSIHPTWWDFEKVIQSNPISYIDNWFIYIWYNSLGGSVTCKKRLYTRIKNFMEETIIPWIYLLFIHFLLLLFFFFCLLFSLFWTNNTIYAIRERWFVILIFSKYLVLEFWLRNKNIFFLSRFLWQDR